MSDTAQKKDKMIIHFVIVCIFMFGFRFLPPFGTLTPYGMAILGIFIGMIWGWSFDAGNLIWPSLLALVALGLTDYGTAGKAMASAFGSESVVLIMLGMFMLAALQESKVTEVLANKLLGAKFLQGKPWVLTAFIILAPGFLTILVNATLVALIMFVVYQSIFQQAGYKKGDLYPAMVLMGFMIVSSLGFSLFPFRGWCLMSVGLATKAGITLNMSGWIIAATGALLAGAFGWILVMRLIPGCKVDKLKEIDVTTLQKDTNLSLTKHQKAVLWLVVANLVGCILLSFAGGQTGIRLYLSKLGVYGWVMFLIAIAMLIKVEGKPLINKKTAPSYFYWDLILVIASAMCVAGVLTTPETGVTAMISGFLAPLFNLGGNYGFLVAIGVITFIATNFLNNIAVTVTMITIVMAMFAQGYQFNLQVALLIITVYGVIGLMTPAGSVNGAMIHAHEFSTSKSAYLAGAIMIVFLTLVMAVVLIPLGLKFM